MSPSNILVCHDAFRLDPETGDILGPGGSVIAARGDQVFPGALVLDVEGLNRIYRMGALTASAEDFAQRARDRSRIEAAKAWIDGDEPMIDPPLPPSKKLTDPEEEP